MANAGIPIAVANLHGFEVVALVLGGLLVVGSLLSGLARRSFLSLTALYVVVGFLLGPSGAHVLHFGSASPFVAQLAIVALIVILFRDGLEVDAELLHGAWRLPLRKLVLAMPLTAGIVTLAAHVLTNLSWTESLLLGALLSPTDPVLSSAVVNDPRVPRMVRHSLNLESGLNDGLALPAVLAFSAALKADGGHFVWWHFVLQDLTIGFVTGVVLGLLASWLLPAARRLDESIPAHQRALYALGVAFATYGAAALPPKGNGLIAVFVCAVVLGGRRPDVRHYVAERSDDIIEIVKLGVFVVFGSLLGFDALFNDGWAAAGIAAICLLVARPVAIFVALAGTRTNLATTAFMGWFGPKGVATMTFSLLVLSDQVAAGRRIFDLAALVVFCSVIAHGLTDTPGARWIARRAAASEAAPG